MPSLAQTPLCFPGAQSYLYLSAVSPLNPWHFQYLLGDWELNVTRPDLLGQGLNPPPAHRPAVTQSDSLLWPASTPRSQLHFYRKRAQMWLWNGLPFSVWATFLHAKAGGTMVFLPQGLGCLTSPGNSSRSSECDPENEVCSEHTVQGFRYSHLRPQSVLLSPEPYRNEDGDWLVETWWPRSLLARMPEAMHGAQKPALIFLLGRVSCLHSQASGSIILFFSLKTSTAEVSKAEPKDTKSSSLGPSPVPCLFTTA